MDIERVGVDIAKNIFPLYMTKNSSRYTQSIVDRMDCYKLIPQHQHLFSGTPASLSTQAIRQHIQTVSEQAFGWTSMAFELDGLPLLN